MKKQSQKGITLPFLLFVIFLVLKLTDNINWEWIWVFSPIWIPFLIILVIWFLYFISLSFITLIQIVMKKRKNGK